MTMFNSKFHLHKIATHAAQNIVTKMYFNYKSKTNKIQVIQNQN